MLVQGDIYFSAHSSKYRLLGVFATGSLACLGSYFVNGFISITFKHKNILVGQLIMIAVIILSPFNLNLLFILTTLNLAFLLQADFKDIPKNILRQQTTTVVSILLLMHSLQWTLWKNPGPCYSTFPELSFPPATISVAEMVLMDINGLISIHSFRSCAKRVLLGCARCIKRVGQHRGRRHREMVEARR